MIDVSIIIVNYKTPELTIRAVNSVFAKTEHISFEIIVIDNNSNDDSILMLERTFGSAIQIVSNKENYGFAKACNIGIKISKGRYIFLLNSDAILVNNAIKYLHEFVSTNLEAAVCGGNIIDSQMKPTHSFSMRFPSISNDLRDIFLINKVDKSLLKSSLEYNHSNNPIEVAYITGANMIISKDVLSKVGGFDEDFFMYFEETELTYRIRIGGYKIFSVPSAIVMHDGGKSYSSTYLKMTHFYSSRYKYYKKVFGTRYLRRAYFTMFGILSIRLLFTWKSKYLDLIKINYRSYKNYIDSLRSTTG